MKQNQMNKLGQPFSKKQKKASRAMMAHKKGFTERAGNSLAIPTMPTKEGLMAGLLATMFGFKVRRKAG